jgi:hypothetical protein
MLMGAEGVCMFDVYLNEKRDRLLVVAKGQPIPNIGNSGRWRKKKGAVAVSDEIKLALQRDGFYWRRRAEHRGSDFKRAPDRGDTARLRLEAASS